MRLQARPQLAWPGPIFAFAAPSPTGSSELRAFPGRAVMGCARHSHAEFSFGAVTGGRSISLHGELPEQAGIGAVVLMNPGAVHACNPLPGEPWV